MKLASQPLPAEGGWSFYSVGLSQHAKPCNREAYIGLRIHPSSRTACSLKFNCAATSAFNKGLFLPPLSYDGALELLLPYGFFAARETYKPSDAWEFAIKTPCIPLWVEESTLKAMAACSIGQLAIGLNGISSGGVKDRSDLIKPGLKGLVKNRERVVVRFDGSNKQNSGSQKAARRLARQLRKSGAKRAHWFTWVPSGPKKTDDFVAALINGELAGPKWDLHRAQLDIAVDDLKARTNGDYSRLSRYRVDCHINEKFTAKDITFAVDCGHRVIALVGATGTNKTNATVEAVAAIEADLGRKMIVLGGYHRASLTGTGAQKFGVISMSAELGSAERSGDSSTRDGLFCCGESAYKESGEQCLWSWAHDLNENPRPTVFVLDEISQVLPNWIGGGTERLGQTRAKVIEALEMLVANPQVVVVAADAFLGDIELDWLEGISGVQPWVVKSSYTWGNELFLGGTTPNEFKLLSAELLRIDNDGGNMWIGCGQCDLLAKIVYAMDGRRSQIIITAEANSDELSSAENQRFIANVNEEAGKYDRVGFSPSISSGISYDAQQVTISAVVQAYAWGAADVVQALNRARRAQSRVLLAAEQVPDAMGILKEGNVERATKTFVSRMSYGPEANYVDLLKRVQPATRKAFTELDARQTREAMDNARVVRSFLNSEGYRIRPLVELGTKEANADSPDSCTDTATPTTVAELQDAVATAGQQALQRLLLGKTTLAQEHATAKHQSSGGTFVDLMLADVSQQWSIAQSLHLDGLVRANEIVAKGPEIMATWNALITLDRNGAYEVGRVMGMKGSRIPSRECKIDARKIWPLLRACGFDVISLGQKRVNGEKTSHWRLEHLNAAER